ncbi:hypothetical protein BBO99_00002575 [Phytophthora kernoviae]|uniref:Ribosome assembly protein 3 n=1 Tax=Phytophthora kernoviae TaxID=325452 RepID=A0A3R7HZL9_9STRA|nr:hypothetical protein JM16_009558 [Phytophthora kernoviae]KAG2530321.1 hypothetical protein JM18_002218 [Phytophthora kernoviae]RLN20920.1 hypothetical protein BBI17_002474 [Phytophthora kernoviae]RLN82874.1 hypothetical protein BBO99_00002575 [Phytophthora kernoviae]
MAHPTWTEDDELEVKQSLHQKEAITAQMIGIISARLNSLQTTANNRKHGLECDLRVNSDYCSKMVPPLVDTLESRVAASAKGRGVSSSTLASNQAMMERLFGPDEKTRAHMQVLKKKKMEIHKGENRRNARGYIEKQLQASIEGHITRTVESFVYGVNDGEYGGNGNVPNARSSVYMNSNLLLLHTFERIRMNHGKRNFKRFLMSELSGALFEEVFWLVFCHFYQKDSLAQQRALADEISAKYVKMVAALRGSMDYLFRVYPYAIASGVCWGFHYLFPGSRHLYTQEFKNDVYLFVCQLLLGLKMVPTSVQAMRRQHFPEEVVDDLGAKVKPLGKSASSTSAGVMTDSMGPGSISSQSTGLGEVSHLPRLTSPQASQTLIKSSSEPSYLGKLAISDNTIAKILEPQVIPLGSSELDEDDDLGAAFRVRRHQQRALFNSAQLSPLMKQYFHSPTKNAKNASFLLRTTPTADCAVGGEETFHRYYRRKPQKGYAAEAQREQENCMREIQKACTSIHLFTMAANSVQFAARYDRLIAALSEETSPQSSSGACTRAEDAPTVIAEATTDEQRRQLLTAATDKSLRCAELIAKSLEASATLSKLQKTLAGASELSQQDPADEDEDETMEREEEEEDNEETTLLLQDLVAAGDEAEDAAKKYARLGVVRKTARASRGLLASAEQELMQHLAGEAATRGDAAVQNEFRDLYMEEFTTAFGDELDQFRQEERFESKDVAYLITCIHAGGDIFSPLQKKLFVESVGASRAAE